MARFPLHPTVRSTSCFFRAPTRQSSLVQGRVLGNRGFFGFDYNKARGQIDGKVNFFALESHEVRDSNVGLVSVRFQVQRKEKLG
jgi:hypothetical protein